jgi:hypothetical protein
MSLEEAVAQAGSLDALRSGLEFGYIKARAPVFLTREGEGRGLIPAEWWRKLRDTDLHLVGSCIVTRDPVLGEVSLATVIEVERAAVPRAAAGRQAESRPKALPVNPVQQTESAGPNTAKRVRERKKPRVQPQQGRARRVLNVLFPKGYPTKEEVPDVDLLKEFSDKYDEMEKAGQLRKSRYPKPSPASVLREAGRKESD